MEQDEALDIPNDLLEKIFKHLSIIELAKVARTCHIAMNVVNTRILVLPSIDGDVGHCELVSFSQDGKFLVTGSIDDVDFDEDSGIATAEKPTIRVWDLVNKNCHRLYFSETANYQQRDFQAIALSPNGDTLATLEHLADNTCQINTWNWNKENEPELLLTVIPDPSAYSIAYGLDNQVYVWTDTSVQVYNGSAQQLITIKTDIRENRIKRYFLSDPCCILELSRGNIKIYECTNMSNIVDIYDNNHTMKHDISITGYDPDQHIFQKLSRNYKVMVTSDENGCLKIWDLNEKKCVKILQNDDFIGKGWLRFNRGFDEVTATFSEDEKSLIVCSTNRIVRTWYLDEPHV